MQRYPNRFTWKDEEIIKKYERWFRFYIYLSRIIFIMSIVAIFIVGLVLGIAIDPIYLLIWLALLAAPVIYLLSEISLSYPILHIYYLKKISNLSSGDIGGGGNKNCPQPQPRKIPHSNVKVEVPDKEEEGEIDEEVYEDYRNFPKENECPSCFSEISPDDKVCQNCGYNLSRGKTVNSQRNRVEIYEKEMEEIYLFAISMYEKATQNFNRKYYDMAYEAFLKVAGYKDADKYIEQMEMD